MPFKSLDLFSGIGGITYALREYFEPTLYCDNDRACQDVLARLVDTGELPPGRLVSDVTSIGKVESDVRAIVGGSPCQSISCMGKKEGIAEGTRSGLFLEIVRLVDENPNIDVLFLENVANILRVGAKEVVETLTARGFTLAWTIRHARGHGAPHKRERWFCLALRGSARDHPAFKKFQTEHAPFPEWSRDTQPPRVAVKPQFGRDPNFHTNWPARQKLLGNSVVPVVVRAAFEDLASKVAKWDALQDTLQEFGTHYSKWNIATYPVHALTTPEGVIIQLPSVVQENERTFIPSTTLDVEGTLMRLNSWPTPRASNVRATRLNARSMGDLGSVLVNCMESQIYVASAGLRVCGPADQRMVDVCVPNTECVEWCMGYPAGWTSKEYPSDVERSTWPIDGAPQTAVDPEEIDQDTAEEIAPGQVVVLDGADEDEGREREEGCDGTEMCNIVRTNEKTVDLDDSQSIAVLADELVSDAATALCASA